MDIKSLRYNVVFAPLENNSIFKNSPSSDLYNLINTIRIVYLSYWSQCFIPMKDLRTIRVSLAVIVKF